MPAAATPGDPFALHIAPHTRLTRAAFAAARPFLSGLLRLPAYRELYRDIQHYGCGSFEARALRALNVGIDVLGASGRLPRSGPLIVAANHPTGALDGLVLIEAVRQVRGDVRALANHLLARIPDLHTSCFFVDPFGGAHAAAQSRAGLRAAHLWLRRGGALVMFPAGEVAWRETVQAGTPLDSPWGPTIGRLALATGAQVVPAFLEGENSRAFYAAGRIHPALRTLLLAREFLKQRGKTMRVCFGNVIGQETLRALPDATVATAAVRRTVDALDAALLDRELAALPQDSRLLISGDYEVFCVDAPAIPNILREIGRLRELTFRLVGEGTGKDVDLDRFDDHYQHLFVWNRASREVVGAYRVGATDRIVGKRGVEGLYTRSLFRYDERMLEKMSPALELGRSFVRREYQRSYNPLLLLWKGIGRLIARSPQYRVLFGPVSISSRYQDTSQQLLRAFLAQEHGAPGFGALLEPVNPPPPLGLSARSSAAIANVEELDDLISRLEGGPGIPVLLRQYLKLNATVLGFNVDPAFRDALDALMMVDLTRVSESTLRRYLGRRDAEAFLAFHRGRRIAA
jgi:putative hemolysin